MAVATQDVNVLERAIQTPKRGHVAVDQPTAVPTSIATIPSASSVSTWFSPAVFDDIWDLPETPIKQMSSASLRGILTPLTPPTPPTLSESSKRLSITPVSKLSFGSEASLSTKQQPVEKKDVAVQDDTSQIPKLFRNLTFELQAISQQNIAATCVKYEMNPSFVFSDSVSSRTRSKTSSKALVTSAIHATLPEGKRSVKPPQQPNTTSRLQSKLWASLGQIIPHDLHARLVSKPGYCVASLVTNPSVQCSYKAKPLWSPSGVGSTLKRLAKCKKEEDYCGMLTHIERVVQSVMCNIHQKTALHQFKAGSRIAELRSQLEDITSMTQADQSTLAQWVDAIVDPNTRGDHNPQTFTFTTKSKPTARPKSLPKLVVIASTAEIISHVPFSSSFIPYQPRKTQKLSVSSALHQKAASPLGSKDYGAGFIYLYWDKEFFGMVKIGYTNNLARRLKEWNQKCKRQNAYHSSTESQVKMPHVYRVEELIHTELKEYRLRKKCDGCGVMHKEWFQATQSHVVKVLKKWREWILQEPYEQDEKSGKWTLRPDMLESLEHMCEPLPCDMAAQKPCPKPRRISAGVQRSSQKNKNSRRTM
ncbi:hypothetical protein HBI23_047670 [Parastagonospora nodorum]|nr:hypothetical protein HBI12_031030 [Parastagonospora nodorum]KAH5453813.1 hypothetical protein HBI47_013790 [Parastagonospora nodorum]KAH5685767.1 hypothetical protein HBI23_047670 [Parastagonospora nodorum]